MSGPIQNKNEGQVLQSNIFRLRNGGGQHLPARAFWASPRLLPTPFRSSRQTCFFNRLGIA